MADQELSADSAFVKAVRYFTCSSYAQTVKNKLGATDNVFYCPVSIVMALAALHVGAKGNTARQIEHVLGLSEAEAARLPCEISKFLSIVESSDVPAEDGEQIRPLGIANLLALQAGFQVESSFTEILTASFRSELSQVDFQRDAESARRTLNTWISGRTANRIPELFAAGVLNQATRLVLANAVRFDAGWEEEFEESDTFDAQFSLLTGAARNSAAVRMMARRETKFVHWRNTPNPDWPEAPTPYVDVLKLSIASLPYLRNGRNRLEMLLVLPDERDGLHKLETLLSEKPSALDDLIAAFYSNGCRHELNLQLPSFKFALDFELASTLKQLGATDMFSAQAADFGGISQPHARELSVSSALHHAVIDVDEKGTRAAAATAFAISLTCMPIPEVPIDFVVDHPCLFVIASTEFRLPLFVGRLALPKRE